MRRFLAASVVVVALAFLASARAAAPALAPIPAEDLFRSSALLQAEISPDGTRFGAITVDDEELRHLLLVDLKTNKSSGIRAEDEFDIPWFSWLGDQRVLYRVRKDKIMAWGLFVASFDRLNRGQPIDTGSAIALVGTPQSRPGRVILWVPGSVRDSVHDGALVELDANRQPKKRINFLVNDHTDGAIVHRFPAPKAGQVVNWLCTRDGDLALVEVMSAGQRQLLRLIRRDDQESWHETSLDFTTHTPLALDFDGHSLWVAAHSATAGTELRRLDLDNGQIGPAVYTDATYDFSTFNQLHFSPATRELTGLSYLQRKPVTAWFSKTYAALQAQIDALYPGTANTLVSQDRDEKRFLFHISAPQRPGAYVIFDTTTQRAEQVADSAGWLAGRSLLPVQPVSYRTRDGVKLEGYLALPPGASEQSPVPLVVLVHGPWERATPSFDAEVQFFASRGYAVFQPHFRGAPGYAPVVSREHQLDFALMHRDISDGVRAMLRSGYVDPKRVAVFGTVGGSCLALAGLAFETDIYRCGIVGGGIFDVRKFAEDLRGQSIGLAAAQLVAHLSDPGFSREAFAKDSPLANANRITAPLLIADGTGRYADDDSQTSQLIAALKKSGTPHEVFLRKREGESFYNYKNRVDFYHRVEAFLAAQLGGASLSGNK